MKVRTETFLARYFAFISYIAAESLFKNARIIKYKKFKKFKMAVVHNKS